MNAVFWIAKNTFLEAVRQKFFNFLLLLGLVMTAVSVGITGFNFGSSELKFIADFGFGGALADDSFGAVNSAGGSFVETDDIPEPEEEFHDEGSLPQELQGVDISAGVQEKIVGTDEVPMERVIIVYKKEESEKLCKILGLKELSKVVYRLDELNAVR